MGELHRIQSLERFSIVQFISNIFLTENSRPEPSIIVMGILQEKTFYKFGMLSKIYSNLHRSICPISCLCQFHYRPCRKYKGNVFTGVRPSTKREGVPLLIGPWSFPEGEGGGGTPVPVTGSAESPVQGRGVGVPPSPVCGPVKSPAACDPVRSYDQATPIPTFTLPPRQDTMTHQMSTFCHYSMVLYTG